VNIELVIERVVLENIDLGPAERQRVQAAIEQQLTAMVRAGGLHPDLLDGGAMPSLVAGEMTLPSGGGGDGLGARIATSVGAAITAPTGGAS
jgi:hypothetical protein